MKRIFASILGLVTLAALLFQFEVVVSPQSRGSRYYVRVYNVDDVAKVYLNGREIANVPFKSSSSLEISSEMSPGPNHIRLVVENHKEAYTFGFSILKDNDVIHGFECGRVDETGCGNDTRRGIVFDKTVTIHREWDANLAWNAVNAVPGNWRRNPNSNANYVYGNSWSNAVNRATNSTSWNTAASVNMAANTIYYPPENPVTNIRQVDFANFTFYGDCEPWEGGISLINGRYKNIRSDNDIARIQPVKYADFDGDGRLDAFVTVAWTTIEDSGSGVNAYVYAIRRGVAEIIWEKCAVQSSFSLTGRMITHVFPEDGYTVSETYAWRAGEIKRISRTRRPASNR